MKGVKDYLKIKLEEIRKYYPDWECIEIGIDSDHIHLHMAVPLKYSVSKVGEKAILFPRWESTRK